MVHLHVGQFKPQTLAHFIVWEWKKICVLLQLFNPSVQLYLWPPKHIFHIYRFFVTASWRCWGTWLQNRSIHMHNRWVHECRGRPAASGVQPTAKRSVDTEWFSLFLSLPTLFFSTFVEKPFLSLSGHERIKTLLADELSTRSLCWTVAINQASCPRSP